MEQFRSDMADMFKDDDKSIELDNLKKRQRLDQEKALFDQKMQQQEIEFQLKMKERKIANAMGERQLAMQETMMHMMQRILNNNNNNNNNN